MNIHQTRKCPDPMQSSCMYPTDSGRLRMQLLLKTYVEYKRGHLPVGKWTRRRRGVVAPSLLEKEHPSNNLSPKNLELINFLNSLSNKEIEEDNGAWERLERTIDENRLSDRKFFT